MKNKFLYKFYCDIGLTVVLDAHSDQFSAGSLDSDTRGFLGLIRPSGSFPLTTLGSFDIRPGMNFLKFLSKNII